jgi:UDP-N-acetylmuramoyl-L-alanyl-D-glutamate--2,6-diaminopimelate ligase
MDIQKIFSGIEYRVLCTGIEFNVNDIQYDSRKIKENDIFVALIGSEVDGHSYIDKAIENGAKMLIVERLDLKYPEGIWVIQVNDLRNNLGFIASNYFDYPQNKLKVIGVTGTNGKTTSTYILESILKNSSRIGTTGCRILDKEYPTNNTTPESLDLIKLMDESVKKGVEYFLMEVSSHALYQGRVNMLMFDSAIFTNLTQDHLDFHKTMENYFQAKALILNHLRTNKLIVNKDDMYCKRLLDKSQSFSLKEDADITGEILEYTLKGMKVKVSILGKNYEFVTKLMGEYNLQNILGVLLVIQQQGIDISYAIECIKNLNSISGRFELIDNDKEIMVVVDYAHTPDGLENILETLQNMKKNRIITVFGAGGDRDKTKRPLMAQMASKYSDIVYITSDNPRTEDPESILDDVEKGISNVKYYREVDRENAIKKAVQNSEKNDIILIAGKGHEDYQIIGHTKIHFDDREMARKYLGGR